MESPIKVKLGCNLGSCLWTWYTQQKTNKAARIVYCIHHCMCWCPSFLWRWQPVRLILSSDQLRLSDTAFIQTSCEQVVPLCHCCDISWSYSFMWVRENNFIVYFTFYHRMHLDVLCTYCRWHIIYYNIFSYLWNPVTGACSQNIAHSFIFNPIKIQTCTFNVFILYSWKRMRLKCEGFNQFKSCV